MENLNKRIISTLLAGAMTVGVGAQLQSEARAEDAVVVSQADAENMDLVEVSHMKGIYNVIVNNVPVYVYLGNNVDNEYLLKNDALELAKKNYNTNQVYFYSKVIESPNYVEGVTPEDERYNFVYAISDKQSVEGWTMVEDTNIITEGELVASTIELGEFLLKEVDLSRYVWDFNGFGCVDLNHDGERKELVYVGNDGKNFITDKITAIATVNASNGKTKIYEKKVQNGSIMALSDVNPGNGWVEVTNVNSIPNDKEIGTSTRYMEIVSYVASTTVTTEQLYFPKLNQDVNVVTSTDNQVEVQNNITALKKDAALSWAYSAYAGKVFCILQKEYVDKNTGLATTIYAISETIVDGYDYAFDDKIPTDAMIYLSVNDAENYIVLYGKSVTRTL